MLDNILITVPIPSPSGSDPRGDSSTGLSAEALAKEGDMAESQVGTPKAGGVSPSGNYSKKFPLFSVILLLVVSVVSVFCVYLFLQVRTLTLEKYAVTSPSPYPIASPDPTAGWQTYSGTESLNFKYPPEYNLKVTKNSLNIEKSPTRALIYISLISNPESLSVDKWFESQSVDIRQPIEGTHARNKIMVDNQSAIKFTKQDDSQDFIIVFVHGNDGYLAYFSPSSNEELAISNQILSTFKLADTTTDYTCPASGYVDCMPGPDKDNSTCSEAAMAWYKANCPDFQGGAL